MNAIKVFSLMLPHDERQVEEYNRFVSTHRIVSVSRDIVMKGDAPYLVMVVEYQTSSEWAVPKKMVEEGSLKAKNEKKAEVLKQGMTPQQCDLFDVLRKWRNVFCKTVGDKPNESVSNPLLAEVVKTEGELTDKALIQCGLSEEQVQKYAEALRAQVAQVGMDSQKAGCDEKEEGETSNEADGE